MLNRASLALLALLLSGSALAQVPSQPPPPYNTPVAAPTVNTPQPTALITNTARAAGTVNTAIIDSSAYLGIDCRYWQAAESGSPGATIELQGYDAASATFRKLVTSPNINVQPQGVSVGFTVYPGIQTSGNPTGHSFMNYKTPRFLRVQQVITGTNITATGTVGCDLLK